MTERNRIERFGFALFHRPSNFDERCVARGIVHRAVVDAVAVDRLADSEMVKVRTDHDILFLELRITARENAHHILGFHLRTSHAHPCVDLHRQRKVWQWLICVERPQESPERCDRSRRRAFLLVRD